MKKEQLALELLGGKDWSRRKKQNLPGLRGRQVGLLQEDRG